jgi:hypothetical protein
VSHVLVVLSPPRYFGALAIGHRATLATSIARSLTGIRELARAAGADLEPALLSVDLSNDLLRKPDEHISFDCVCALFEHCARAWSITDLGPRVAPRYQHLEILGPVALITRMERRLRGVIEACGPLI